MASRLRAREQDGIVVWCLDAPNKRNAVDPDTLADLAARAGELRGETVVLHGAGGVFCAGFDLGELPTEIDEDGLPDACLAVATAALRTADATTIAAVEGFAIGAGLELACSCDLRVAHPDAYFALPAGRHGVVYHAEGIRQIHAVLGARDARNVLLRAGRLPARDAHAHGSVDELADDPVARAVAIAVELAALAPLSTSAHRSALRALTRSDAFDPGHEDLRRRAYTSADYREARASQSERRPAVFKGK